MSTRLVLVVLCASSLALAGADAQARPQGPPGGGHQGGGGHGMGHGMRNDPAHAEDMAVFHVLLDKHSKIRRIVTERPDGVETLTESDDPALTGKIQEHVAAMYGRLDEGRPIHQRDPLFRELFAHADQIVMVSERTPQGIRVVETSADPYVVKLIKAHAQVVSRFVERGRSEAMTNHAVPAR